MTIDASHADGAGLRFANNACALAERYTIIRLAH